MVQSRDNARDMPLSSTPQRQFQGRQPCGAAPAYLNFSPISRGNTRMRRRNSRESASPLTGDSTYVPSTDIDRTISSVSSSEGYRTLDPHGEGNAPRYALVAVDCLQELFRRCQGCGKPVTEIVWDKPRGASRSVTITCSDLSCTKFTKWRSSGLRNKMPEVRFFPNLIHVFPLNYCNNDSK